MKPFLIAGGAVSAHCPVCGGVSSFETHEGGREFGSVLRPGSFTHDDGRVFRRATYRLLRCANCYRAGLATIYDNGEVLSGTLVDFYPRGLDVAPLPPAAPDDIVAEVREAELCASAGAWRGGSALLRSALEKTLVANGYTAGTLNDKINAAAGDGLITEARKKRAHEEVRSLGNDVVHDEWRAVTDEEFELAHHYVQRVIEDFYDNRPGVEAQLAAKGKLRAAGRSDSEPTPT